VRPAERLSESAQAMTYLEATQADLWHLVAIRQSPIDGAKQRNPLEIYQDDVGFGCVDTMQQAIAWTAPSAALRASIRTSERDEAKLAVDETHSQTLRQTTTPPIRCVATNAITHLYPCQLQRYIFRQPIKELTLYSCLPL
jgi:hypothetical protein